MAWLTHKTPPVQSPKFACAMHSAAAAAACLLPSLPPRLPLSFVPRCNAMNEVWVPSQWAVDVFAASGVERSKLVVVPEGVNTSWFDPERYEPVAMPQVGAGPRGLRGGGRGAQARKVGWGNRADGEGGGASAGRWALMAPTRTVCGCSNVAAGYSGVHAVRCAAALPLTVRARVDLSILITAMHGSLPTCHACVPAG